MSLVLLSCDLYISSVLSSLVVVLVVVVVYVQEPSYLVVASDGVWDSMTQLEVSELVSTIVFVSSGRFSHLGLLHLGECVHTSFLRKYSMYSFLF